MYWEDDKAIGVDDEPCTFYRPNGSSGSIFLNSLMVRELKAMEYLAACLNMPEIATSYQSKGEDWKNAVRKHCWDPRDKFYYSVDLNFRPLEKPTVEHTNKGDLFFHVVYLRQYDCLL